MDKDFDFDAIGKRTPFRTPEGFFERMQEETLKRAAEERRRSRLYRLKWGISVALAAAALFCGFVFFPTNQPEQPETGLSAEWTALVADGMDPVDMYIRNLTDEELEEWMEFSENDIFYELTTENLNEDED